MPAFKTQITLIAALLLVASPVHATNGLNLTSYGPVSNGMGGTAQAHNIGMAGAMNNPATLGLIEAENLIELGAGILSPNIKANTAGQAEVQSGSKTFPLPGFGYTRRITENLTTGAAFYLQGGVGTEYAADSFLAAGSGETVRSELMVLRASVPLSYKVTPDLIIGGSIDYVHAGIDLKMAMTKAQFIDFATPGQQTAGRASGGLVDGLKPLAAGLNWVRFDLSDQSALTQETSSRGFGGKLGAYYRATPELSFGASYQPKVNFGDMVTTKAKLSANVTGPGTIPITGTLAIQEFSWPSVLGFGTAWKATPRFLLALDYKRIGWASTMKELKMNFTADSVQESAAATTSAGKSMDAAMYQNWKDQNVFALGAAYAFSTALTLRAGANFANGALDESLSNPLFAAAVTSGYGVGAGYALGSNSSADLSFAYSPEVTITSNSQVISKVAGFDVQAGYSYGF